MFNSDKKLPINLLYHVIRCASICSYIALLKIILYTLLITTEVKINDIADRPCCVLPAKQILVHQVTYMD